MVGGVSGSQRSSGETGRGGTSKRGPHVKNLNLVYQESDEVPARALGGQRGRGRGKRVACRAPAGRRRNMETEVEGGKEVEREVERADEIPSASTPEGEGEGV